MGSHIMATATKAFHSASGVDFLGLRAARSGDGLEIVYDDGVARRMVWRVRAGASEGQLADALARAVNGPRVVPALYTELRRRAIAVEAVCR
ncbi:hypothetical protein [Phaeovulum vinaykumarii]|uniref:Uncharacterized protein n=2 Tax=Phaeovulum vinaykumarii TaxID=407234 RepID=A0A1N7LH78_9RHOB|nr:hypothetical protein [Phaeovulum vinaykumarii]SIS73167.1 hypothetical protein SAMN05421795_10343 [Phaeovulum vinaykumarii]SOC04637.1 hypothetical protein SAMN05878426_10343 [Phaeovulum vinaykumarii]